MSAIAADELRIAKIPDVEIDPITLDIIENALRNARYEMDAVLFRSADLEVAVVGPDHKVTLKAITTGRDFGTSLEVLTGLAPGENIVANPPDSLATGTLVRVVQPQSSPAPAAPQVAQLPGDGQS